MISQKLKITHVIMKYKLSGLRHIIILYYTSLSTDIQQVNHIKIKR